MQNHMTLHPISDPYPNLTSNVNMHTLTIHTSLFAPTNYPTIPQLKFICAANRRKKRYNVARSSKLMLQSACIIASKLRILPEHLELLLREFGTGNGGGGDGGFWDGFGMGGFDGWGRRRRGNRLGVMGILVICGVGLCWVMMGKEIVLDGDAFLGGLGLVLFGLSVGGWRRGAKDWLLGFCFCAFLVGLVAKKGDFRTWVRGFGGLKKGWGRKRRAFW